MYIPSIHPFTSGMEPMMFFSEYERRIDDGLELYKKYFETAQKLGAGILVFHGDKKDSAISVGEYAERYSKLYELGKSYNVTVCQENVPRCRCSNIGFISELKRVLGDDVKFVADFKQAIRSEMDVGEMIRAMGKNLLHVHISDSTDRCDCLAPSKGTADLKGLLKLIEECSSAQNAMIELYSHNFSGIDEVIASLQYLNNLITD